MGTTIIFVVENEMGFPTWLNQTLKAISKETCSEHRMGHSFSGAPSRSPWFRAQVLTGQLHVLQAHLVKKKINKEEEESLSVACSVRKGWFCLTRYFYLINSMPL